ncbi:MAG TPA: 2-dehydropantoate 2-reductase N-terminal domain-containing protein [Anaerolineales bacterium]|nr:2-dehydropantoate 2-reductase N-terminal domain-containing protein [Anaerolineales bacterium]
MKTLIVGAGIIGSIYGWAFAEAGHEVTHLVRPGKAAQFSNGFEIDMYDVRKGHKRDYLGHYPIRVTETLAPSDGYDLVIVPTKHYHLLATLKQLVPQAGNADFWLLTQNWDGTEEIDALLSPTRYVFGDAKAGGKFEGNNLIATIASVDIGQVGGRHDACLEKVIALCKSAQVGVTVHDNILHYLWVQYAITGGLWPALVKAGSLEAVLENRSIGEQGLRAVRESLEVIARRGVDLTKFPDTKMYMGNSRIGMWIAGMVIKVMFRYNKLVQRSSAHGLADIEEVRAFFYDLLHTGRKLNVPMSALSAFETDIQNFKGESPKE